MSDLDFLDELPTVDDTEAVDEYEDDVVEEDDLDNLKKTIQTDREVAEDANEYEDEAPGGVPEPIQTPQTTAKPPEATGTAAESPPVTTANVPSEAPIVSPQAQAEPEQAEKRDPPEQADLVAPKEPVVLGGSKLPQNVSNYWDSMMSVISSGARNAIWEKGLDNMTSLLRTPVSDLVKPRGTLAPPHIDEINRYLADLGYCLTTVSPRGSGKQTMARGRPQGIVQTGTGKPIDNQEAREARNQRLEKLRSS